MRTASRQFKSGPKQFQCPLLPTNLAVCRLSSSAYCPKALWGCIGGVLMPTAPRPCGSVL